MTDYSHLHSMVLPIMDQPPDERMHWAWEDRWIGYPQANQAIRFMEDQLAFPRTQRPNSLLLVGDSGNGKTTILKRFYQAHQCTPDPDVSDRPVIMLDMPSEPNESRFWSEVLMALRVAHRANTIVQAKKNQAIAVLRDLDTRVLIIDEIHNLLLGSALKQRQFLGGVLKNLINELRIAIVAAGTRDAVRAWHVDSQMVSRFTPMGLRRWALDAGFLKLLASFERVLPLRYPSHLASRELAIMLHRMSEGTIGNLSRILKAASVQAIRSGKEKVTSSTLQSINWATMKQFGLEAEAV